MAVSAVIAAVSTGVTALAGGTFLGIAAIGLTGAIGHFLITTAMGAVLNSLSPKPSIGTSQGYSINGESGSALDHQIVYGRVRVGGVRVYDCSTGDKNKFLHRIMAFTGHEIEGYDEIYLNDEVVTLDASGNVTSPSRYNGFVRIKKYFGTSTQTADADLVSETASVPLDEGRWTSSHRLRGIAYLYVRFKYDTDAFPNGVPSVSATIKGRKVYDPRNGTTAWSDNPALCIRDYLTADFGFNQPSSRIDDVAVVTAANICDQTVDGEDRYTCNGNFVTSFAPNQVLSDLLTSMGGLLWYSQGKWRMKAASYTTPTITLDEGDLRSAISLSTRHSRRNNFNTVKGKFKGPETDFQEADYPTVTDPVFVADDNGLVNTLDFALPFTNTSKTAQRLANIALRRNREQLTFSASFGLKAFQVQVGDFIYINNERFGWSSKPFEVTSWTFGLTEGLDLQVQMTLREISSAVFTEEPASVFENNNTTLPDPFTGFEISNLVASGGGRLQSDGTFINSVILDWDAPANEFVEYYEIEWKAIVDSNYNSTTSTATNIELSPLIDQIQYEIRVRAVSTNGIRGPWTSVLFTGGGDVTAPSLPTAISAVGDFKYITIKWTNPPQSDFNYVEVWENATNTTVGATKVGISSGDTFQRTNLPIDTTKWYFLKSVDYSGNVSGFTSGVSATTTGVEDADFANGIYSLFTDQGLYAIKDVTVLPVAGSFTGEKVFNRTDGKLYQWTGTAWGLVVAQVNAPDINGQLVTNQIATGAITNALISTNAITETKISSGAITTPKIAAGAVTANEIATGAVTAIKIAANSVTSDKIVAGTIQASDIAAGTITANEIATNTITGDRIVANTITGGLLATSGIITNSAQINDLVVTNAKIANSAITTAKISDAAITSAKIGTAEITTLKIGENQVTIPYFYYNPNNYTGGTILSFNFNMPVACKVVANWQAATGSTNECNWIMYLNGTEIGRNRAGGAFQDAPVIIGGGDAVAGNNLLTVTFSGGGTVYDQWIFILGAQR